MWRNADLFDSYVFAKLNGQRALLVADIRGF